MAALKQLLAGLLAQERLRVLVARDHLGVPAARYDLLNLHRALRALFEAQERALVSQIARDLLAVLATEVLLVLGVAGVAQPRADVATIQTELAALGAASLGRQLEVLGARRFHAPVWVVLAAQRQGISNLILFPQGLEDVPPEFDLAQHGAVGNTVKAFLGPRQGDTDAIGDA